MNHGWLFLVLGTLLGGQQRENQEPLKSLVEKVRRDGKTNFIGHEMALFFGMVEAPKPGEKPPVVENVRYLVEKKGEAIHLVMVTEKMEIIYVAQDQKKNTSTVYLTGVDGLLRKAGVAKLPGSTATEIPIKEAKEGFDKEVAYWKDKGE